MVPIFSVAPILLIFFGLFIMVQINFFSWIEFVVIIIGSIFVLLSRSYRKVDFSEVQKTTTPIGIIIAPEVSASIFASYFIRERTILTNNFAQYLYVGIGTPRLKYNNKVLLACDTSDLVEWGIPTIDKVLTIYFILLKLKYFIRKHKEIITNILIYSSPDFTYYAVPMLRKATSETTTFITTGVPEKDVIQQKVGKQTIFNFKNSDRILLPMSGGKFELYYNLLKEKNLYDENKIIRCQSTYLMEFLEKAKDIKSYSKEMENDRTDVIVKLGSRMGEIYKHNKIGHIILKHFEFKKRNERIVFLAPNERILDYLRKAYSHYRNSDFDRERSYDYSKAKMVVSKSGTALIKPILAGIPTIPFYLPAFKTELYTSLFFNRDKTIKKEDVLLPHLITNSYFLSSKFIGRFDFANLINMIDEYLENPPNMEKHRILLAKEFLQQPINEISTFGKIVDTYLTSSIERLGKIRKMFIDDTLKELQVPSQIGYVKAQSKLLLDLRSNGATSNEIFKGFRDMGLLPLENVAMSLVYNESQP